jgi:hypothetical protein
MQLKTGSDSGEITQQFRRRKTIAAAADLDLDTSWNHNNTQKINSKD